MTHTLFLAAGPMNWYSSKARCYWIAEKMQHASAVQYELLEDALKQDPQVLNRAGVIVFQKIFDVELAKMAHAVGKRVLWDICDPMYWFDPHTCKEIIQNVDAVVTSNPGLTSDFIDWSGGKVPTSTIADRVKLDQYPLRREHRKADPVRLIWFGLGVNRFALMGALPTLERLAANGHKIELTIQDDQPHSNWQHMTKSFSIYHVQFQVEHENQVLAGHDLAILPPYPGPWGKVKSNNRTITAWACGLPVVDGFDYQQVEWFMDADVRARFAEIDYLELKESWLIEKSAAEWEALCE